MISRKNFLIAQMLVGLLVFFSAAWAESPQAQESDNPSELNNLETRRKIMEKAAQEIESKGLIELKALEIRARIHEPNVIYVLDRTRMDIEFEEEKIQFGSKIDDPIVDDRL